MEGNPILLDKYQSIYFYQIICLYQIIYLYYFIDIAILDKSLDKSCKKCFWMRQIYIQHTYKYVVRAINLAERNKKIVTFAIYWIAWHVVCMYVQNGQYMPRFDRKFCRIFSKRWNVKRMSLIWQLCWQVTT